MSAKIKNVDLSAGFNADVVVDETENLETVFVDNESVIVSEDEDEIFDLPKNATLNANGTVTLKLKKTVRVMVRNQSGTTRTDEYESLTFHPLTGKDLREVQTAKETMQNIILFACSCKISKNVMNVLFDKLDANDVIAGSDILSAFTNGGRKKK